MRVIGVTGGIGSGKSSVASILSEQGAILIDADSISRQATQKGSPVLKAIVQEFGDDILTSDGTMDRSKVSAIVFNDDEKKKTLEFYIHKYVVDTIDMQLATIQASEKGSLIAARPASSWFSTLDIPNTEQVVVLDVPIPIERGFLDVCDVVIAVICDEDIRVQRVMSRSGLDKESVHRRIHAQRSQVEYVALANATIDNNEPFEMLSEKVYKTLKQLYA